MRRIGSLRMAAAAVLFIGVASIAFIVAALYDTVEVSLQQTEHFVAVDERVRRAIDKNRNANDVIVQVRRESIANVADNSNTRGRQRKTTSGV